MMRPCPSPPLLGGFPRGEYRRHPAVPAANWSRWTQAAILRANGLNRVVRIIAFSPLAHNACREKTPFVSCFPAGCCVTAFRTADSFPHSHFRLSNFLPSLQQKKGSRREAYETQKEGHQRRTRKSPGIPSVSNALPTFLLSHLPTFHFPPSTFHLSLRLRTLTS